MTRPLDYWNLHIIFILYLVTNYNASRCWSDLTSESGWL